MQKKEKKEYIFYMEIYWGKEVKKLLWGGKFALGRSYSGEMLWGECVRKKGEMKCGEMRY